MRYVKTTTQHMFQQAMREDQGFYEVSNGETTLSCYISPIGVTFWEKNRKVVTEQDVADVLARWAVEGVGV